MESVIIGIVVFVVIIGAVCGVHPFLTGDTDLWSNYLEVAFGDGVFYQFGLSYVTLMAHIGDVMLRDGGQVNLANDIVGLGTACFKIVEWFVGFVIVMAKSLIEGILSLTKGGVA